MHFTGPQNCYQQRLFSSIGRVLAFAWYCRSFDWIAGLPHLRLLKCLVSTNISSKYNFHKYCALNKWTYFLKYDCCHIKTPSFTYKHLNSYADLYKQILTQVV